MYNPPRGDNILLYVKSGYSPPDELTLHVSTVPLDQSDVNAALDAMIAESAAFNFESIDCAPIFGSLAAEVGASLPAPIGDTKLSTLRAETQSWHVIPCEAGAALGQFIAESVLQYRGVIDGNAIFFPLSASVDFCLNCTVILPSLIADTVTSLIIPVNADVSLGTLWIDIQTSNISWLIGDSILNTLFGESITYIEESTATSSGVLQFDSVDIDEIISPTIQADALSNILQFTR